MTIATVKPAAGVTRVRPSIRVRLRRFGLQLLPAVRAINLTGLAAQVSYSMIFAMPSILLIGSARPTMRAQRLLPQFDTLTVTLP